MDSYQVDGDAVRGPSTPPVVVSSVSDPAPHGALLGLVVLPALRTEGFTPPFPGGDGRLLFFDNGWELWDREPGLGYHPVLSGRAEELHGVGGDGATVTIGFSADRFMDSTCPVGDTQRIITAVEDVLRRYGASDGQTSSDPTSASGGMLVPLPWGDAGADTIEDARLAEPESALLSVARPPDPPGVAEPAPPRPPARRRRIFTAVVVAVAVIGAAAAYLATRGPSKQSRYLAALDAAHVRDQFTTTPQAVANAKRVCADLDAGKPNQGYARDRVGVQIYCPDYLAGFKVLPTPEEQQASYLGLLRSDGLAGKFTSDANAVANARRVCDSLHNGAKQQGLAEDQIGVQVYCPEFLSGFHVLEHRTASGTFTLIDSDPSIYFPAIGSAGGTCWGSGGYSDIGPGTEVYVKNPAGTILAHTSLGAGVGGESLCVFNFSVDVTEGEDAYLFEVSHRGTVTYTFPELESSGPALSLGS